MKLGLLGFNDFTAMSLNNKSGKSTPNGSRVRQAFKSPFRVAGSPDVHSIQVRDNVNNTTLQGSPASRCIKRDSSDIIEGYREEETETKTKTQTPLKAQSKGAVVSCSTPQRIETGNSPQLLNSSRRKVMPRNFSAPFRSPTTNYLTQGYVSIEEKLAQFYEQEAELDKEITSLKNSGYKTEELQSHIEALHRYNETKDAAQLVMGRLAELEGVTIKEIHEKYGVPVTD